MRTTHVFNQADQSGNWQLAAALRRPSCCLAAFNPFAYINPCMLHIGYPSCPTNDQTHMILIKQNSAVTKITLTKQTTTSKPQSISDNWNGSLHDYPLNLRRMLLHPLSHIHRQTPWANDSPCGSGFHWPRKAECQRRSLPLATVGVACLVEPLMQPKLRSTAKHKSDMQQMTTTTTLHCQQPQHNDTIQYNICTSKINKQAIWHKKTKKILNVLNENEIK